MIWIWIVLGVIALIAAGVVLYHCAEHRELRKMRTIFGNVEKTLYNYFKSERETVSHDGVTFGELPKETVAGAGFAVQKMLKALDDEEKNINHEFIDCIKSIIRAKKIWKKRTLRSK